MRVDLARVPAGRRLEGVLRTRVIVWSTSRGLYAWRGSKVIRVGEPEDLGEITGELIHREDPLAPPNLPARAPDMVWAVLVVDMKRPEPAPAKLAPAGTPAEPQVRSKNKAGRATGKDWKLVRLMERENR